MNKLVSIIIPLYNKEKWVKRAIDSVLNQTYKNFELLIINDGSTDNSLEVVKQYKDKRIRIFSKSNEGLSLTRNFGIKQAKGEYIAFLDADDEWGKYELEYLLRGFEEFPEAILVCSDLVEIRNEKEKNNFTRRPLPFRINSNVQYHKIDKYIKTLKEGYFLLSGSSVLIKKEIINKNNLYFFKEAQPAEDVNYWIRLSRYGEFVFCDYVGAFYYRVDENSIMNKKEIKPKRLPPFSYSLNKNSFTKEEIKFLNDFLVKEYLKKAYQNRGLKFEKYEITQKIFFDKSNEIIPKFLYLTIRFMPNCILNLLKKIKDTNV